MITHGEGALVAAALERVGLRQHFDHIFDKHTSAPGPKLLTMAMVPGGDGGDSRLGW